MDKFNVALKDLSGEEVVHFENAEKLYIVPFEYLIENNYKIDGYELDEYSCDTPFAVVETCKQVCIFPLMIFSVEAY